VPSARGARWCGTLGIDDDESTRKDRGQSTGRAGLPSQGALFLGRLLRATCVGAPVSDRVPYGATSSNESLTPSQTRLYVSHVRHVSLQVRLRWAFERVHVTSPTTHLSQPSNRAVTQSYAVERLSGNTLGRPMVGQEGYLTGAEPMRTAVDYFDAGLADGPVC
jgi:hypothetical protein